MALRTWLGAAMIKYHRQYGLSRKLFSYSSGCLKSKVRVLAELVSSEDSLLGLQMDTFTPHPHVAYSMYTSPSAVSSSSKGTKHWIGTPSQNIISPLKALSPDEVTLGLGFPNIVCWGDLF